MARTSAVQRAAEAQTRMIADVELGKKNFTANIAKISKGFKRIDAEYTIEIDDNGSPVIRLDNNQRYKLGLSYNRDYEKPLMLGTPESEFQTWINMIDNKISILEAIAQKKKLAADTWDGLTYQQQEALKEYPPSEMTENWNSSNC